MADVAAQMSGMHSDHAIHLAGQQRDILFGDHHRLAVEPDIDQRVDDALRDFGARPSEGSSIR